MSFSADWLALREPFDTAARSVALVDELRAHLAAEPAPLEVVDLGCGAGSNVRYLAPRLGSRQRWRLVDHDSTLLDAALSLSTTSTPADLVTEQRDLRTLDGFELPTRGLVTAAALLDLVSHAWLATLAERCRDATATVYFALTYDGRTSCSPAEPEDREALGLFNRHQRGDKGFGPALGPAAAHAAEDVFKAAGYRVAVAQSDWLIGSAEPAMQQALLDGWAAAAGEIAPNSREWLQRWHERRQGHVEAGRSELRVGHVDLIGWL